MKLTEQKLREIIKEEIASLNEKGEKWTTINFYGKAGGIGTEVQVKKSIKGEEEGGIFAVPLSKVDAAKKIMDKYNNDVPARIDAMSDLVSEGNK
jgi:hypothetical protein